MESSQQPSKPHPILVLMIAAAMVMVLVSMAYPITWIGHPFIGFRSEPTLTVSAVNSGAWPAMKAGLAEYDRIVAVDGQAVATVDELQSAVDRVGNGGTVTYTYKRPGSDGKERLAKVPIRPFAWSDLGIFWAEFVAGFAHLVIGAIAYLLRPKSALARAHLYMTTAMGLALALGNDYDFSRLFVPVWMLGVCMGGSSGLHLGLIFPEPRRFLKQRVWPITLIYGIGWALFIAWWATYKAEGVTRLGDAQMDTFFSIYNLAMLWGVGFGFLGMVVLILTGYWAATTAHSRQQAKVALLGGAAAYLPMVLLWMVPTIVLGQSLDGTGTLLGITVMLSLLFPLSIAYAIVRHKLFDIDFIIKQSLLYSLLVLLLGGGYFAATTAIQSLVITATGSTSELTYLAMTGVVAIVFDPLRHRLRELIDRRFFRAKYDFKVILGEFVEAARTTIHLDELIGRMNHILDEALHPAHISLYLRQEGELRLSSTTGETADLPTVMPRAGATTKLVQAQMALVLPLTVTGKSAAGQSEIVGILALGPKRSELDYTGEDRQLLASMSQQLALTVHNAQLASVVAEKEALKRTLEQARLIQRSMLPDTELALARHQLVGYSESADETGGDYYDWSMLPDGRYVVAIGDVTGHGIDAALIVAMAKSCLFNQIRDDASPQAVMRALNETIHSVDRRRQGVQVRKLMTLLYGVVDPQAGTMAVASAGHFYPLIYRAEAAAVDDLEGMPASFPLGTRAPAKFQCPDGQLQLAQDDVVLFFTDGVHEAHSPQGAEYGLDRLKAQLQRHHALPAAEIRQALLDDLYAHIGQARPVDDDITLLVLKVAAPA